MSLSRIWIWSQQGWRCELLDPLTLPQGGTCNERGWCFAFMSRPPSHSLTPGGCKPTPQVTMLPWAAALVEQERQDRRERERKTRLQKQFDAWEAGNEEIQDYNEQAPQRALKRKMDDQAAICRHMLHLEDEKNRQMLIRIKAREARLNLLSDHAYVQWMFDCAERSWMPPV
jgi:hypothetical protein